MVWLTLLAWGLEQEIKKGNIVADGMPAKARAVGGQVDGALNPDDFDYGKDQEDQQGLLEQAEQRARDAVKRAETAEGRLLTMEKVWD